MDSIDPRTSEPDSSQVGSRVRKRTNPPTLEGNPSQKKQKPEPRRPYTRAQKKSKVTVADGDPAPEPVEITSPPTPLPLPAGQPPVSSKVRAALCDSIVFWRAHQGGIQSTNSIATGMLLNGKTTPRDILQAQVIVTTVGSGLTMGADGKRIRTEDQSETSKNYVYLKNAMDIGNPIGIVIGKQPRDKRQYANDLLDIELVNHYNVLDWFFVTDMWSERQPTQRDGTSYVQYMVRLQSIKLDSNPWWVPRGQERSNMHAVGDFQCRQSICQSCETPSKEIFKEGWCCLKKACPQFFQFMNTNIDFNTLQYNAGFLNERKVWTSKQPLQKLVPELPILGPNFYGSEPQFKGGVVCPTCKFASRRISWEGWRCENGCGFELLMPPRDVPLAQICGETLEALKKKGRKFYLVDGRIKRTNHTITGYEVTNFYLPNRPQDLCKAEFIGCVTIFRPTKSTLERSNGLNDLFQEIQEATRVGDVKLQRHPAFCRGSHMEELTSHFSCNMGADYKFGVAVETSNGFDTAPDPIMKALSRLTWSGAKAVALTADYAAERNLSVDSQSMPNHFVDFNEQLMLGYFRDSQISFHDDGEKELGPTVATLSLGSPSLMRFRGKKKAGFQDTIGNGDVMLSFVLEHGDIVIMHGTKIHQHYEHAVSAEGVRRYALTCRYIRPEMIPDPKRREKAIINGRVPVYWQKQAYQGEPIGTLDQLLGEAAPDSTRNDTDLSINDSDGSSSNVPNGTTSVLHYHYG